VEREEGAVTRHIAIVDDDTAVRIALGDLMRSVGYRTTLFASADEFLATANREEFDGVIADVQMPGSNGFELAAVLSAQRPVLPVILITARPDGDFEERSMHAGTVALLRKPVQSSTLFEHVEKSFF
jgi:FixJ family two-component response regulator